MNAKDSPHLLGEMTEEMIDEMIEEERERGREDLVLHPTTNVSPIVNPTVNNVPLLQTITSTLVLLLSPIPLLPKPPPNSLQLLHLPLHQLRMLVSSPHHLLSNVTYNY
jgi:hypothetical protein